MNKKLKLMLGLTFIVSFIVLTGVATKQISMLPEEVTEPEDPGNSRGPGFDASEPMLPIQFTSIVIETTRMPSRII